MSGRFSVNSSKEAKIKVLTNFFEKKWKKKVYTCKKCQIAFLEKCAKISVPIMCLIDALSRVGFVYIFVFK